MMPVVRVVILWRVTRIDSARYIIELCRKGSQAGKSSDQSLASSTRVRTLMRANSYHNNTPKLHCAIGPSTDLDRSYSR
jgi:hypothetical protein